MTDLDILYIIVPPAVALLMAAGLRESSRRRTVKLDAKIAAYRARKAEERKAIEAAEEARLAETASTPVRSKAPPPLADLDALLRRASTAEDVAIRSAGFATAQSARESREGAVVLTSETDVPIEVLRAELIRRRLRVRPFTAGVRVKRDVSSGQMVVIGNPPYFPSRSPAR